MSPITAAIDRGDVASYVNSIFTIFIILIISWIVIGWVVMFRGSLPYVRPLRVVTDFIEETVTPYLNIFRRVLKPIGIGGMGLDLSPMVAIIVLVLMQSIVVGLIAG